MSKRRIVSTLAAGFILVAGACWFVTGAFPLSAEPQMVADAAGVSVDMHGAQLLHRASVFYPREISAKGIQGTVLVQVKLDENASVSDAAVLSGPDELRKSVLQSVLGWHFSKDAAGTTRQIGITFQVTPEVQRMAAGEMTVPGVLGSVPKFEMQPATVGKLSQIAVMGLSDGVREQLMTQLQVHIGDAITPEAIIKLMQAVRQFDEHLTVNTTRRASGETTIRIAAPGANAIAAEPRAVPRGALVVGGSVQAVKLISQPQPVYPPLAKKAHVFGLVQLSVIIGKDGHVQDLEVIKGHPLLTRAALEAVQDWVYEPTLLNGEPVAVQTTIDVNFTLSQ